MGVGLGGWGWIWGEWGLIWDKWEWVWVGGGGFG